MYRRLSVILAIVICLSSCSRKVDPLRDFTPFVRNLISSPEDPFDTILNAYDRSSAKGDVYLLDFPDRAVAVSEYLLSSDLFDNVDSAPVSDSLPDFAGERIVSVLDFNLEDSAADTASFRDHVVYEVLSMMNSQYSSGEKNSAKLVIATSSDVAFYSSTDLDTLFRPLVIYPSKTVLKNLGEKGASNIGVITPYKESFEKLSRKFAPGLSLFSASLSSLYVTDPLKSFLSEYSRTDNPKILEALIVDEPNLDRDGLTDSYLRIILSSDKNDELLKSLLSDDFEIIDLREEAAKEAYLFLRNRNLFTHEISYPISHAFCTDGADSTATLRQFDLNLLPPLFEGQIMVTAPKTYSSYVQNNYYSFRD